MSAYKPIDENDYAQQMKTVVEPYLADLRKDGYFDGCDGKKLHYESYILPEAKRAMVVSHGFTESAEKFREMSYYFLRMGYSVFAVDHRGHGYSARDNEGGDPYTVHIDRFDTYIEDLNCFVVSVVKPAAGGLPLYLYGHSMGGAVSVLYLMKYPHVFEKCVLNAPMISANTANLPHFVTGTLSKLMIALGKGKEPAVGTGVFNPNRTYENSNDTSKARFDYYHAKRCADKHYQTSRPSYSWVHESIRIIRIMLDKKNCAGIRIPVLVMQAEQDGSCNMLPQNEFASLVPNAVFKKFPGSKHEIYMSPDAVMVRYLDTISGFLEA